MDLWSALGPLWDEAFDGQASLAAAKATHLANVTDDAAERGILLSFVAMCEALLCRYSDATATALLAAETAREAVGDSGDEARFFADSTRLLAASMLDPRISGDEPALPLPQLGPLQDYAKSLDPERPERLLLAYPVIEATLSYSRFAEAEELIAGHRPFGEPDDSLSWLVSMMLEAVFARSLAYSGRLDELLQQCDRMLNTPGIDEHPQMIMLVQSLLCFAAGQRADRDEVEKQSELVLHEARRYVNYVAVGSCLLVSEALAAVGQVQRAAALLVSVCGGPELSRIKTWDRALGYDLLVNATLRRGELASARHWAQLAEPLAIVPAAASASERAVSRVSAATGDMADAVLRSRLSARLDEESGARLAELSGRLLYASALASSGARDLALAELDEVEESASELGATTLKRLARRQSHAIRALEPAPETGFNSLSEREREIAILVAEGHTNRSIGATLFLSERTVQTHLSRILKVMGLPSRTAIPAALGVNKTPVNTPPLTARQEEIARLISRGHSNAAIANELSISVKTVENHLAGIFSRWQVSSRTAVAHLLVARDGSESKKARTT
jgi:DNA-binding NarL/FixJ family response regulator